MTRTRNLKYLPTMIPLIFLVAALTFSSGCSGQRQSAQNDAKKPAPISEGAPKLEPIRQVTAMTSLQTVESVGDCAPEYKNGLHGACINNQPCRGIGVLDQQGKPACSCYGKAGGCGGEERCDAIKKACVPESEKGFGRAEED